MEKIEKTFEENGDNVVCFVFGKSVSTILERFLFHKLSPNAYFIQCDYDYEAARTREATESVMAQMKQRIQEKENL